MSRTDKSIATESRLVASRACGERGKEEPLLIGIEFPFWGDENVLKLDSGAGFTIL